MMIGLGVFHVLFIILATYLVYRVYKLVKFQDIPILLSITCVLLSLIGNIITTNLARYVCLARNLPPLLPRVGRIPPHYQLSQGA